MWLGPNNLDLLSSTQPSQFEKALIKVDDDFLKVGHVVKVSLT
jgi:hypothetical protein